MTPAPARSGVADEDVVQLDAESTRRVRRRSLRVLGDLLRPQRRRILGLVAIVVLAQTARASGPALVAATINHGLPALEDGNATPAYLFGLGYLLTALSSGVLGWSAVTLTASVSQTALLTLRRRTFRHVQRLSLDFHERYTSGRAITRQTSDLDAIRELLDSGINHLLSAFVFMGVVATLLFVLDPISGAMLLFAVLPIWLLTRWFHHRSQLHYRETRVAATNLIVQFVDTLTGIRAVQAFRREPHMVAEQTRLAHRYRDVDTKALGLVGIYEPGIVLVSNLTVAIVLAVDGYRVLQGDLPLGTLIAAVLYAQRFFTPMERMVFVYNAFQAAVASLEKISGLLEQQPDLADPREPAPLVRPRGRVQFDHVTFGYDAERTIIDDLDLTIPAGQTVALIGATGAGKSTVAKLIARFYDVTDGAVHLDGVDVRRVSFADLRRHVVVVTQESFLFSGTIADNIAMGRPTATRAEIEAAARAVGAHVFIEALEDGYDTDVNKRGGRFSAGQRQLVSFARAFIADPTVLILDEATSSLDLVSETAVQRALATLLVGRTAVIIAHRLSTVDVADRVLVFRDGRVIEDGSPQQLVAHGGEYARLRSTWDAATALPPAGRINEP